MTGDIQILFPNQIEPLLAECKDRLDVIKEEEYDRELDNKSKHAAIKANKIAKCAIIISRISCNRIAAILIEMAI